MASINSAKLAIDILHDLASEAEALADHIENGEVSLAEAERNAGAVERMAVVTRNLLAPSPPSLPGGW